MKTDLLKSLSKKLKSMSLVQESKKTNNIADIMSGKKKEIKNPKSLFKFLEDNKDLNINIDSPKGSKKGFGYKKRTLPFDYGEIVGVINPADNMGWDIIFPPSEEPSGKNLSVMGILKVNDDKDLWNKMTNKNPPIGNDKIIVSSKGTISEEDKNIISTFFETMWQFKKIKWLT